MRGLISIILIFFFYTHSLNVNFLSQGFFSTASAKTDNQGASDLTEELKEACEGDTCNYDYDGEGAARGDKLGTAWEQVVLFTMASLTSMKISQCLFVKNKWVGINPTFKKVSNA